MTFEQALLNFVDDLIRIVREINAETTLLDNALALIDHYVEDKTGYQ